LCHRRHCLTSLLAGFGFQFSSLDNVKTQLHEQYENLLCVPTVYLSLKLIFLESIDSTPHPAWYDLVFKSIWRHIPDPLLNLVGYLPIREHRRYLRFSKFVRKFSQDMVEKSAAKGDGNDIMSVLLRANASEDPKGKLTNDEVIAQIRYVKCAHCKTSDSDPRMQYPSLRWTFDYCTQSCLVPVGNRKTP